MIHGAIYCRQCCQVACSFVVQFVCRNMLLKICTLVALSFVFTECMAEESYLDNVKKSLENIGESIGDTLGKAVDSVKDHASHAKEVVEDKVEDGGSFFENAGKALRDAMHTVGEKLGVVKPSKTEEITRSIKATIEDAAGFADDEAKDTHRLIRRSVPNDP